MSALFYESTLMDSIDPRSPASIPGSDADRIRALLRQGKYLETLAAGEALLAESADHRDVLLCVAVASGISAAHPRH